MYSNLGLPREEKKGKRENKKGTHFLRQHASHVLLYVA